MVPNCKDEVGSLEIALILCSIDKTMKQLIFRLNHQQHRNHKYKHRDHVKHEHPRNQTQSVEKSIERDDVRSSPECSLRSADRELIDVPNQSTIEVNTSCPSPREVSAQHETILSTDRSKPASTWKFPDVYEIPGSPEPLERVSFPLPKISSWPRYSVLTVRQQPSCIATLPCKRSGDVAKSSGSSHSSKHKLSRDDPASAQRDPKRRKTPSVAAQAPVASMVANDKSNKTSSMSSPSRKSPREKKTTLRPDLASEDQLQEAMATPAPASPTNDTASRSFKELQETLRKNTWSGQSAANDINQANSRDGDARTPPETLTSNQKTVDKSSSHSSAPTSSSRAPASPSPGGTPAQRSHRLPTASSILDDFRRPASQSSGIPLTKPTTPTYRPSIEFVYSIILSRTPVYKTKGWQPLGRFQEKSIAQLISEAPFSSSSSLSPTASIKGISITMEGPGVSMEEQFLLDDESHESRWESLKRRFKKQMNYAATTWNGDGKLIVDIEIEPLRKEDRGETQSTDFVELDEW